jgi:predicted DNA-binding transcriptional regulator AlpA
MPTIQGEPPASPLLLSARNAARTLAVSQRTLWGMTYPRGPIRAVRIGRAVRYALADLQRWIDAQQGARS